MCLGVVFNNDVTKECATLSAPRIIPFLLRITQHGDEEATASIFTCREAAGPRKARVVVVVVGEPNRYVSYSQSIPHYKLSSGWDPIFSLFN